MSLEKDIEGLDKLIQKLDNESLTIDQSLTTFNEAIAVAKKCLDGINESKGKLMLLKNEVDKIELDLDNEAR